MNYPGHVVKVGATGAPVAAIRDRLIELGYDTIQSQSFDSELESVVMLFQSQHFGADARPLQDDGEVGPLTWGALFGQVPTPVGSVSSIARSALGVAITQIGVMEDPVGSNRGPEVDGYLDSTGTPHGSFWCMAFIYFCFEQAASDLGVANPFPKTAGCIDAWNKAKSMGKVILQEDAIADPALVKPGAVFILDFGGGHGHTGFVKTCIGGSLRTVEGNTDPQGTGNGIGVFELNRRNVMSSTLKGFIDFT